MRLYIVGLPINDLEAKFAFQYQARRLSRQEILDSLYDTDKLRAFTTYDDAKIYAHGLREQNGDYTYYPKTPIGRSKVRPIFTIDLEADTEVGELKTDEFKYDTRHRNGETKSYLLNYHKLESRRLNSANIIRADFFNSPQKSFELNLIRKELDHEGHALLTRKEKQKLLLAYIENFNEEIVSNYDLKTAGSAPNNNINLKRREFNAKLNGEFNNIIETAINKHVSKIRDIETDPADNICKFISINELQELVYDLRKEINDKFASKNTDNRMQAAKAIEALTKVYYTKEIEESKKKALKSTLLFSLFVITIPFAYFFYNKKLKDYEHEQNLRSLLVSNSAILERSKLLNKESSYGLVNKLKSSQKFAQENKRAEETNIDRTLFSRKSNIRKVAVPKHSIFGFFKGYELIGTKKQIQAAEQKFNIPLHNRR